MLRYLFLLIFKLILLEVDVLTFGNVLVLDIKENVDLPQEFFALFDGILNSCSLRCLHLRLTRSFC